MEIYYLNLHSCERKHFFMNSEIFKEKLWFLKKWIYFIKIPQRQKINKFAKENYKNAGVFKLHMVEYAISM